MRQHRKVGQSLVIIALLMVFIVAMVGLSVDVGHAYAQQRRMQNAANAGALGGLNVWLAAQGKTSLTNEQVWKSVEQALAGNRVEIDNTAGPNTYQADYILMDGTVKPLGRFDETGETVTSGNMPNNVSRLRVLVTNEAETFFARIVYQNTFTVNAVADACWGNYGLDIYPIGMPGQFRAEKAKRKDTTKDKDNGKEKDPGAYPSPTPTEEPIIMEPYHRIFDLEDKNGTPKAEPAIAGDQLGNETLPLPGGWNNIKLYQVLYFPIENKTEEDMPGTHIAWLSWSGDNNSAKELENSLTPPGNVKSGIYKEGPKGDNVHPIAPIDKSFQPLDWIAGDTGVKAGVKDTLEKKLLYTDIMLPVYDEALKKSIVPGEPNGSTFHSYDVLKFRLVGFDMGKDSNPNQSDGVGMAPPATNYYKKYMMLQYLGPATKGTASGCAASLAP